MPPGGFTFTLPKIVEDELAIFMKENNLTKEEVINILKWHLNK